MSQLVRIGLLPNSHIGKDIAGQLSVNVVHDCTNKRNTKISVPAIPLSRFLDGKTIEVPKIDVGGSDERIPLVLEREGAFESIWQTAIEYHNPRNVESSRLGHILAMLERKSFTCEVYADLRQRALRPIRRRNDLCTMTPMLNK